MYFFVVFVISFVYTVTNNLLSCSVKAVGYLSTVDGTINPLSAWNNFSWQITIYSGAFLRQRARTVIFFFFFTRNLSWTKTQNKEYSYMRKPLCLPKNFMLMIFILREGYCFHWLSFCVNEHYEESKYQYIN